MSARIINVLTDTTGKWSFDPNSCAHAYTYNGDGTKATDLATDTTTGRSYLKTYTYAAGKLASETGWVAQAPAGAY